MGYHADFDHCWSNDTSVYILESAGKLGTPLHTFQGHSKSSSVMDRSGTYDLLLTFHSQHELH